MKIGRAATIEFPDVGDGDVQLGIEPIPKWRWNFEAVFVRGGEAKGRGGPVLELDTHRVGAGYDLFCQIAIAAEPGRHDVCGEDLGTVSVQHEPGTSAPIRPVQCDEPAKLVALHPDPYAGSECVDDFPNSRNHHASPSLTSL